MNEAEQVNAIEKQCLRGCGMKTRVVNKLKKPFDIYIGRPSKWGNPFRIGRNGTREQVIDKYRHWITTQPKLLAALPELKGKRLGCWCHPLPCHGDVLVDLIEGKRSEQNTDSS